MRKRSTLLLFLSTFLICLGCHSAKKSFKRGDYDDSVFRSAAKLRDNPTHATSLEILRQAYPSAVQQRMDDINNTSTLPDLQRWEQLLSSYLGLNKLYESVKDCRVCMESVKAKSFYEEERNTRQKAAETHYAEGKKFMTVSTRENARLAYEQFERVDELIPNYNDIKKKLDTAYDLASFKVVVEQVLVTSKRYQLSNTYFQDEINHFLKTNRRLNKFVQFYTPLEASDARLKPDHVITLQFDDFVVGQTLVEKNTETVYSKDSVKIGEKTVNRKKIEFYDKVKASFTRNRKTVHSNGVLDMRIAEFSTRKLVTEEKFSGEYNWMCEWANFNGDERALTATQLKMCKTQELLPPDPQQLFVEFSKPIYDRLTDRLRAYYARY